MFGWFASRKRQSAAKKCQPRTRLRVEELEARDLPSNAYTPWIQSWGRYGPMFRLCTDPCAYLRLLAACSGGQTLASNSLAKIDDHLGSLWLDYRNLILGGRVHNFAASMNQVSQLQPNDSLNQVRDGCVLINAVADSDPQALEAKLTALGWQEAGAYGRVISGWLPIQYIGLLPNVSGLRFATAGLKPRTAVGNATSEGVQAMGADAVQSALNLGYTGAGITVGVLSDSYNRKNGANANIASGDLPPKANINVLKEGPSGTTDEGRAMMQIVHDVAPGASLAFYTAWVSDTDFASGIQALANAGAKVITDDVFYYNEPMFTDGIIAQAVNTVQSQGVAYFSSAGNQGRQAYEGAFADSGVTRAAGYYSSSGGPTFRGGALHDFGGGNTFQSVTLGAGDGFTIDFQWATPYASAGAAGGATIDMDIYVLNASNQVVAGAAVNDLTKDPTAIFGFTNGFFTNTYRILIVKNSAGPAPADMKYVYFQDSSNTPLPTPFTNSGANFGHSAANGALAVGAAVYSQTPPFGSSPPVLETFSSSGGTPIYYKPDGTLLATPEVRQKPEIVAPDGVKTTFGGSTGFNPFFGTSAAAPHAAGVAALMLQATPSLTPDQIYTKMKNTAIPMSGTVPNYDSGYGFLNAFAAVEPNVKIGAAQGFTSGASSSNTSWGQGVVTDTAGNQYVTGSFMGTVNFGGTSKTSAGDTDIFVAKYNPQGTLLWVDTFGDVGTDDGQAIAVDSAGNVYVTGDYFGSIKFDGTTAVLSGGNGTNPAAFVLKLNTGGTYQWVQTTGSATGNSIGYGIQVSGAGNVYVTGGFTGSAKFGATVTLTSAGDFDGFVWRVNADQSTSWAGRMGGTGYDAGFDLALAPDVPANVIYVIGTFSAGSPTFGALTPPTNQGSYDIFVEQLTPTGTPQWVKGFGGSGTDSGYGIALDKANPANLYITGLFQGAMTVGSTNLNSNGDYDTFIAKLNSSGTVSWAKSVGGGGWDEGDALAVDQFGSVYVTGFFNGTVNFNPGGNAVSLSTGFADSYDIYVLKLDTSGKYVWAQKMGGSQAWNGGFGITLDAANDVFTTGQYAGPANFGPFNLVGNDLSDIFLAKLPPIP